MALAEALLGSRDLLERRHAHQLAVHEFVGGIAMSLIAKRYYEA
jgi:hypothetical protein